MSISLNGANTFEVGNLISQYHVSSTGAVTLANLTTAKIQSMRNIFGLSTTNLQRTAYADVMDRAVSTGELLNTSIQATAMAADTPPGTWVWTTPFPNTGLGNQLKMIARLIQARGPAAFNMHRQIFFCSVGGYDTHTNQVTFNNNGTVTSTTGTHANLLGELWPAGALPDFAGTFASPLTRLHLYGKQTARAGRKMGHLAATGETPAIAVHRAVTARNALATAVGVAPWTNAGP